MASLGDRLGLDPRSRDALKLPGARQQRSKFDGLLAADRVIDFIECLTVPSGIGQGGSFRLREWQKRFLRDIYEPCDPKTEHRIVRRAILCWRGRTARLRLIAALALVHLIGPEAIHNGEIYSAANDRDQAGIIYKVAAQIVRADPELSDMLRCIDSTKTIACYRNGSFYRAVSSRIRHQDGINPDFVVYDELARRVIANCMMRLIRHSARAPIRYLS